MPEPVDHMSQTRGARMDAVVHGALTGPHRTGKRRARSPRTADQPHQPDPVDVHVGKQMKLRRGMLRVSQEDLAEAIGVTFQQVQKYESGYNRVSASRLWDIAGFLQWPVSAFFDGLSREAEAPGVTPTDPSHDAELMALHLALRRCDPDFKSHILSIVTLAGKRPAPTT